jgi:hypothetical protein
MRTEKVFYFPGQLGEAARFRVRVHRADGHWRVASEHLTYARAYAHAHRLDTRYGANTALHIERI